jgi:uncharacterized protein
METVIVDAGPLVAYLKRDEEDHAWVVAQLKDLRRPLLTCEAVLSEAFFLLRGVHDGPSRLLELLERGLVVPDFTVRIQLAAIGQLMRRYESVPMSLADACLVRMSELAKDAVVFTLDSDFRIYRRHGRQAIPLLFPG